MLEVTTHGGVGIGDERKLPHRSSRRRGGREYVSVFLIPLFRKADPGIVLEPATGLCFRDPGGSRLLLVVVIARDGQHRVRVGSKD
jgi:hypothetical protein